MRLWHQYIINYLPNRHLLGQHRELCALRGLGFGKKHSVVDYVFTYPYYYLYKYHMLVMKEMKKRKFKIDKKWLNPSYRGKKIEYDYSDFTKKVHCNDLIYKEHNNYYLKECLYNLQKKNIYLKISRMSYIYIILSDENILNLVEIID